MDNPNINTVPEIKKEPLPRVSARDYIFLAVFFALSILLSYSSLASPGAGYALSIPAVLICAIAYLKDKLKFSAVSYISLTSSFIIAISFLVHGENSFSYFKLLFLIFSVSIFFISACGFDQRRLDRFGVVFSPLFVVFGVSLPNTSKTSRAIINKESGIGSKFAKIVLALLCAMPLAAILTVLLAFADAAFESFVDSFNFEGDTLSRTLIFGIVYFVLLFSFVFAVKKNLFSEKEKKSVSQKGIDSLFANTVLSVVALIYLFFIITQFSYIFSGFAGLLPKDYTYSEYARRGFGEMCIVCIINFALVAFSMAKITKNEKSALPSSSRALTVFISGFSLFLIVVAIAKMFLYIQNYGLTFLRLGTSVFMLFLFVVFTAIIVKTFKSDFSHIRIMISAACIIMSISALIEPYAVIASFNTYAYESGMHENIDVWYLYKCGDYGIEPLIKLTGDDNIYVSDKAKDYLNNGRTLNTYSGDSDIREFSLSTHMARKKLVEYKSK